VATIHFFSVHACSSYRVSSSSRVSSSVCKQVKDEHEEDEVAADVTPAHQPVLDRQEQDDYHDEVRDLGEEERQAVRQRAVVIGHALEVEHGALGASRFDDGHEVRHADEAHDVVDEADVRVDVLDVVGGELVERRAKEDGEDREEERAYEVVLRIPSVGVP
jgi:hypothetical protein